MSGGSGGARALRGRWGLRSPRVHAILFEASTYTREGHDVEAVEPRRDDETLAGCAAAALEGVEEPRAEEDLLAQRGDEQREQRARLVRVRVRGRIGARVRTRPKPDPCPSKPAWATRAPRWEILCLDGQRAVESCQSARVPKYHFSRRQGADAAPLRHPCGEGSPLGHRLALSKRRLLGQ